MPAPKQPFFRYEPLDSHAESTRMLKLLPGPDESDIECTVIDVTFPFDEPYHALSYEWGDAASIHPIKANGTVFYIQQNLHTFLWQIRSQLSAELPMLIWADAICIDHYNVDERNHQVKLMRTIYSQADEVLLWLGDEADGSTETFQWLNKWTACANSARERVGSKSSDIPPHPDFVSREGITISQDLGFSAAMQGLMGLSTRTYWSRVWIVQEVLLAVRVRAFAGPTHLQYGALEMVGQLIRYRYVNSFDEFGTLGDSPRDNLSSSSGAIRRGLSLASRRRSRHRCAPYFTIRSMDYLALVTVLRISRSTTRSRLWNCFCNCAHAHRL